ncbi:MAG: hypothetical protein ACAI44_02990 [Candidatus Sericytochromatia bacterium]
MTKTMTKTMKMVRKQLKGVNRQVKRIGRKIDHKIDFKIDRKRPAGPGLFTGLLLLGVSCAAGLLLLGKRGEQNRETLKQLFRIEQSEQGNLLREKVQHQFHDFIGQMGSLRERFASFGRHEMSGNGVKAQQEEGVVSGRHIQTMGDV